MSAPEPDPLLAELRAQGPVAIRVATSICTLAFVAMWLVDPYLAVGDDLVAARAVRLVVCVALVGVGAASFLGDLGQRHARGLTLAAAWLTGAAVVAVTYLTGGTRSDYHEALYVAIFGYAVLPAAWRRYDAPVVFVGYLVLYDAALLLGGRWEPVGQFVTHNVLILAAVVAATALRQILTATRRTELVQREELEGANRRLTALDEAKSRFFANLSHELRTPLTLILAPIDAMLESPRDPPTDGQRERLQLAQRNALRLLRLVDDLLALTRAEAASLKLQAAPVDVAALLAGLEADTASLAARKRIALSVEVDGDVGEVQADATLVERVLLNLLGNALKFTAEGGHVALRARVRDAGVELVVSDDGIGIAAKDLPSLFTRFYQADSGSTRSFGGTGIGLALSKEIVELHGGRIDLESELGKGTTVRAWLPRVLPPDRAPRVEAVRTAAGETGLPEWHQAIRTAAAYRYQGIEDATERRVAPRPRPRGHASTVLVVEDNPDMIRFLVALLATGYNVITAQNGVLGLKLARERLPDLVISDVMMPEMDGFELARHLRADPSTGGIPVVFLTARGSADDRVAGRAEGAEAYLPKPFRAEELLAAVEALLSRQRTVRDAFESRQDEAIVFMASGLADVLSHAVGALVAVEEEVGPDGERVLHDAVGGLREVHDALARLVHAGVVPVGTPAWPSDAVSAAVASVPLGERHLDVRVPDGLAVMIHPTELTEVLVALLRRAVAATPTGRTITVSAAKLGHDRAAITVIDGGPGLTPEQVDRVFFPFGPGAGETGHVADALALTQVLRVVRARGGTVGVEARHGLGTAIVVGLPLASESGS